MTDISTPGQQGDSLQGLELRTELSAQGSLVLSLEEVLVGEPAPDEVLVQVRAAPINPSDIALLLAGAGLDTMRAGSASGRPALHAQVPPAAAAVARLRHGLSLPTGNEGAGTVVKAGVKVSHLLGRTVAALYPGMYAQYRIVPAARCIVLPEGVAAADAASIFVNPLTALGMVETMRREGHRALVHTAAASNLGQMLHRICQADGVPLVNVVRSEAQAALLHGMGAVHVVNSASAQFEGELAEAIAQVGATIAFDAVGGGRLAGVLLHAMEQAAMRQATGYNRYGSGVHKQVYIYGNLDSGPTLLDRGPGFAWSVSGFHLTPFMASTPPQDLQRLKDRVVRELKSTFASRYTDTLSLFDLVRPEVVARFARRATGAKSLIDPGLGRDELNRNILEVADE